MTISGPGIFFDGMTSARHAVTVELGADALRARAADGDRSAPNGPTTNSRPCPRPRAFCGSARPAIRCSRGSKSATVAWPTAIDDLIAPRRSQRPRRTARCGPRSSSGALRPPSRSFAVAVLGVPEIATRLAPLVPYSVERKLGDADRRADARDPRHPPRRRRIRMRKYRQARSRDARRSTSSWANSRPRPPCRCRSTRLVVRRRRKPMPSPCRADTSMSSRVLIDKAETPDELAGVHRARDRPCRPSRRQPLGAGGRRAVVPVRHAARRFRRRRRGDLRGQDHPADQLLARRRDRGRRLWRGC